MSTRNFLIMTGGILAVLFILLGFAIRAELNEGTPETAEAPKEESSEEPAEEQTTDTKEETKENGTAALNLNEGPLYAVDKNTDPVFQYQSGVSNVYPALILEYRICIFIDSI